MTLAAKFFLWPLAVWLAATRRVAAAALAVAIGLVLLVVTWAAIGFAGLADYPELMRRLQDSIGEDSYTLHVVALDVGLSGRARTCSLAGRRSRAPDGDGRRRRGEGMNDVHSCSRSGQRSR